MSFAIHRDKADIAFSEYLRAKVGHCEICYKKKRLEVSHYWGRGHEATRFDPENCDILCNYHHRKFHSDPGLYEAWKRKKIGNARYDALMVRAHSYCKKDRKFQLLKIIKTAEQEGIVISAKQAKEKSDKNSPVKDGNIIMEALDKIDKQIRRVTKKSGRRHVNFQCDNPDMIEPLTFELEKAGYEVSVMEKMVKVEW